jgi:hypothetical protein
VGKPAPVTYSAEVFARWVESLAVDADTRLRLLTEPQHASRLGVRLVATREVCRGVLGFLRQGPVVKQDLARWLAHYPHGRGDLGASVVVRLRNGLSGMHYVRPLGQVRSPEEVRKIVGDLADSFAVAGLPSTEAEAMWGRLSRVGDGPVLLEVILGTAGEFVL